MSLRRYAAGRDAAGGDAAGRDGGIDLSDYAIKPVQRMWLISICMLIMTMIAMTGENQVLTEILI